MTRPGNSTESDVAFTVTVEPGADETVLHLHGELDLAGRGHLVDAVEQNIAAGRSSLRLELATLNFCDSTGLATMIRARRLCIAAGGWLHVTGAGGQVANVLRTTGLGGLLIGRQRPATPPPLSA